MKSFKAEVIADRSGKWCPNGLSFATRLEAEGYVSELSMRWTLVSQTRVVESDEPVNAQWVEGQLVRLPEQNAHLEPALAS